LVSKKSFKEEIRLTLKYFHILVALDGSKQAEKAFKKAVYIAVRNQAVLNLASIVDNRSFGMVEAYDKHSAKRAITEMNELLEKYKKDAEAAGVQTVNIIVEFGVTKEKISRELVNRTGADLIVCGATGLTGAERVIMGSVSQSIVRYAKCDVLVVRREEDAYLEEETNDFSI